MSEITYDILFVLFLISIALIRMPQHLRYGKIKKMSSQSSGLGKMLVAITLIAMPTLPLINIFTGWLDRFDMGLPDPARLIGLGLAVFGVLFLVWIHRTLGKYWSPLAEIMDEHKLIKRGPYKYIRHPMYTVFYIFSIAIGIVLSSWFIGISSFMAWHLLSVLRIRTEENMLINEFGDEYREYMSKTGSLLPKIMRA